MAQLRFVWASIAILTCLFSCGGGGGSSARLAALTHATIEPGAALGNLRLGQTTLGEFVDAHGSDRVDLVVSDSVGLELIFERGEMSLLFLYDESPREDSEVEALRHATRDLQSFLAGSPSRRELRLASVTVAADDDFEATLFQGELAPGIHLLDPLLESVARLGVPEDRRPPMLAGASPNLPRERAVFPDQGVVLYGEPTPSADRPSRVTRISIFVPEFP